jgi:hypothetical protein
MIFDKFFRECNPMFLQECDPLVALSVATSLTANFTNYARERIDWLEEVLQLIDYRVRFVTTPYTYLVGSG